MSLNMRKKVLLFTIISFIMLTCLVPLVGRNGGMPGKAGNTSFRLERSSDNNPRSEEGKRSDPYYDVDIHLKEGGMMSTLPPEDNNPVIERLEDGDSISFSTVRPLYDDLPVRPLSDEGKNAIKVRLASLYTGSTTCWMTVRIFDGDEEMAASTFKNDEIRTNPKLIYLDTAIAPDEEYIFHKGRHIKLKINVSIREGTLAGSTTLSYDSMNTDSHLSLYAQHIGGITFDAYKGDDVSRYFHPNPPEEERHLTLWGEMSDVLGDYDIGTIAAEFYDADMTMVDNVTGEVETGEEDAIVSFSVIWKYDPGLPPGEYTAKMIATDNSGNNASGTSNFHMERYGIRLRSEDGGKTGVPGSELSFSLLLRNIGGVNDTVGLTADPDPSECSWNVSLQTPVRLDPGEMKEMGLKVRIPNDVGGGAECRLTVTAVSGGDPSVSVNLSKPLVARVQRSYLFKVEPEPPLQLEVPNGGRATYGLTVVNTGELNDTLRLELSEPPSGWEAGIDGDVWAVAEGNYPRIYLLGLNSGEEKEVSLLVQAPEGPGGNGEAKIELDLISQNDSKLAATVTTLTTTPEEGQLLLKVPVPRKLCAFDEKRSKFETVSFELLVRNGGSAESNIAIGVEPNIPGWEVEHPVTVTVSPLSEEEFNVYMTPGSDTPASLASDGTEFKVTARRGGSGEGEDTVSESIFVEVEQYYSIEMEFTGASEKEITKRAPSTEFRILVKNRGNGPDRILLDNGDASRWTVEFTEEEILLSYGMTRNVTVTITAPDDAADGDEKRVEIFASGHGEERVSLTATVAVRISTWERFDGLITDIDFWVILGLFICVVVVVLRIQFRLKREKG